jgi:1-acyl-sn-glycerol-3-phosphate acyltransferase
MALKYYLVNASIKGLIRILCRVDDRELAKIPARGPLILVANHVNFLDVPLIITHLQPRPVTGWAKVETWDNLAFRFLFNLWGGIPIRRGELDLTAFHKALNVLNAGKILAVAPEGTRSGDGHLQKGYPGVVLLALRSGAPLMPVVYYGGESFWSNLHRLARTNFHIMVGNPFTLDAHGQALSRDVRQSMTDEIMYQMAALLPPAYRGWYADLTKASEKYLNFAGKESNLRRARDFLRAPKPAY